MASKGRKQKVKFQWTKELGFLIGALVVIIAATIILAIPTKAEKLAAKYNEAITLQNTTNSTSYYTIQPTEHVFEEIEFEKLEKLEKALAVKDTYVFVVYGSEYDTVLLEQLYNLNTKAETVELENIYIYSSAWYHEQEDKQAVEVSKELLAKEEALFGSDIAEFSFEESPALLVFYNGELVFNSQDAEDISGWAGYIDYAFEKYSNKAE